MLLLYLRIHSLNGQYPSLSVTDILIESDDGKGSYQGSDLPASLAGVTLGRVVLGGIVLKHVG